MTPGYYWARYNTQRQITHRREWRIVQVVPGLVGCVLDGGFSVVLSEYSDFVGPLVPPNDKPLSEQASEAQALHKEMAKRFGRRAVTEE